jgi:hypothetical protein
MADVPRFRPARPGVGSERTAPPLVVAAVAVAAYVIAYPFTRATYPPLTDLPFHAAQASILRHYFDPSFHFREQFTIHPLEAPYVSMYAIGALFALVLPITTAAKLMSISMLALMPAGLAVLLLGMKKSPLWALLGTGLTWCTVTQWGFLSFMGATGLFAMSIGFALMVVDDPTPGKRIALGVSLVAIFFTHVYRFPFAIAGVLLAGALVFPTTRRFSVLLRPLVPGLFLFALWILIRPRALSPGVAGLGFHAVRLTRISEHLFGSYWPMEGFPESAEGNAEHAIAKRMLALAVFAAVAAFALRRVDSHRDRSPEATGWTRQVTNLAVVLSAALFVLYLILPLEVGQWFYVYPREIVGVALFLIAALPDLPRGSAARAAFVVLFSFAVIPMTTFVAARFHEFEENTADFRDVVSHMPPSPRLTYLIYWLGGSLKTASPFLHLPAWIQAEKGGALGFHFAKWGFYPVRYRSNSPSVPPPSDERFEWTPQFFDVQKHGAWFDTFLVRHKIDPHELFDRDPSVHLVGRYGTWWLYRRGR